MVDRCVCEDTTFRELLSIATREGLDFDSLAKRTGCSLRCGLCEPYIRAVLDGGPPTMGVLAADHKE
ncbi:MAG: hypothetical protein AAF235_02130 [Planctomycetota bacterium]